jgi:hypothetical protein
LGVVSFISWIEMGFLRFGRLGLDLAYIYGLRYSCIALQYKKRDYLCILRCSIDFLNWAPVGGQTCFSQWKGYRYIEIALPEYILTYVVMLYPPNTYINECAPKY